MNRISFPEKRVRPFYRFILIAPLPFFFFNLANSKIDILRDNYIILFFFSFQIVPSRAMIYDHTVLRSASWLETGQRLYVFHLLHQQISLTPSCKCDSPIYNARLTLHVAVPHSYVTFYLLLFFSSSYEIRGWRCMTQEDGGKVFRTPGLCLFPLKALTGSIPSFNLSRNKF